MKQSEHKSELLRKKNLLSFSRDAWLWLLICDWSNVLRFFDPTIFYSGARSGKEDNIWLRKEIDTPRVSSRKKIH